MSNVLSIKNVVKKYESKNSSVTAIDNVSIDIEQGEFISIVGPSGCGKSTLLRILSSLETISSGSITLNGKEISGPVKEINMIFQESRLFPWLTAGKNVDFVLPSGMDKAEKEELVTKYLNLVGLGDFRNSLPSQLSGGMQQRVSIARALVTKPEILLLDEPFGALDAFTKMTLQIELNKIWKEQKNTMILVTHDIDEAIFLSSRIVIMSERPGKIKDIVTIDLPGKRQRNSTDFLEYRKKILSYFLEGSNPDLEYYI